jgi:hypothetical protein
MDQDSSSTSSPSNCGQALNFCAPNYGFSPPPQRVSPTHDGAATDLHGTLPISSDPLKITANTAVRWDSASRGPSRSQSEDKDFSSPLQHPLHSSNMPSSQFMMSVPRPSGKQSDELSSHLFRSFNSSSDIHLNNADSAVSSDHQLEGTESSYFDDASRGLKQLSKLKNKKPSIINPKIEGADANDTNTLSGIKSPLASSSEDELGSSSPEHPLNVDQDFSNDTFYHDHEEEISKMPLSLKIMHRPSRAQEQLEKANDPTRRNSIFNSHLCDTGNTIDSMIGNDHGSLKSQDSASSEKSVPLNTPTPSSPSTIESTEPFRLVRKKSGEILKPSLKDKDGLYFRSRRTLSLPTTPTFKQVHFGDDNLVKYFKKRDKPSTISASNSPNINGLSQYNDDDDSSISDPEDGSDDDFNNFTLSHGSTKYPHPKHERLIDWEVKLLNFAPLSYLKKIHEKIPVFLERVFITNDRKYLVGHIAVKNLDFEKHLTVRYSRDGWCTIIEIPTVFESERPDVLKSHDYDRFSFMIPLESLFNSFSLENSTKELVKNKLHEFIHENTYEMCIKYSTKKGEFWDNNNWKNYGIKIIKLIKNHKKSDLDDLLLPNKLTAMNSKIQDHFEKPKYSNKFLKRRLSESDLKKEMGNNDLNEVENKENNPQEILESHKPSNVSSDFVNNNFYLSSPLFSLYNKLDQSTDIVSPIIKQNSTMEVEDEIKNKVNDENNKNGNNVTEMKNISKKMDFNKLPKFTDSKSYKELLDNYCFFATPKQVDSKNHDNKEKKTGDPAEGSSDNGTNGKYYAVSSFLGV